MTPELISLAKQFRISVLSSGKLPVLEDMSNEDYLLEILRAERKARDERATRERFKQARLPAFKSLDEFDTQFQKVVTRTQLVLLARMDWMSG